MAKLAQGEQIESTQLTAKIQVIDSEGLMEALVEKIAGILQIREEFYMSD